MRIVIVVTEFPPGPGGVGHHAFQLAQNLSKMGHNIAVLCNQDYASRVEVEEFNWRQAFPIHTYPRRSSYIAKYLRRLSTFWRVIHHYSPDVVVASGSNSVWTASFFRFFWRKFSLVVVAHGGEFTFRPLIRKKLTQLACKAADHIVSVSEYTKQKIPKSLLQKITVIHNGADDMLFKDNDNQEELKKRFGYAGRKVLLTVGSVSERKGQDIVIRAMKHILQRYPETVYLMAGRSNNLGIFMEVARKEGVEDSVFFLGTVTPQYLVDLYNMADLYVMASRHSSDGDFEGFGISVIEAALCGLPAVITRNSGLVEAIEDGITGLSVPPNDPEAIANAVINIFEKKLRVPMGTHAKERAKRNLTWNKVVASYDTLLRSLR